MSKWYGWAMQNLGIPLMVAPTRSRYSSLARQMRKNQRLPLEELQKLQLAKLRNVLALAASESPFYRTRYNEADLSVGDLIDIDDLRQFPITSKEDIEANFPDGIVVESRRNPDWQYIGTRGTTRRVMVVYDFERRDFGRAATLLALTDDSPYCFGARQLSIPPDACSVHCGIESERSPSVTKHLFGLASGRIKRNREGISDLRGLIMDTWVTRNTTLPPLLLDGSDDSLRFCIGEIRKIGPLQLMALPEYLRALANYVLRTGDAPPPITVIRPVGANFPKTWKEEIETAFRGKLREHYGSREMDSMAFDCRCANGLHQMMDRYVIEVLRDGRPVNPGETGSVVVTDLHNLAMPMIRYQIGDLARVEHGTCPCGRTTPRMLMEGRIEDAFVTDDGRILTSEAVANHFASEPDVFDFQLTESQSRKLTLRVTPRTGKHIDERSLGERFLAWSQQTRPIAVRTTSSIRPETSGKYRHCKSQSFHHFDAPSSVEK